MTIIEEKFNKIANNYDSQRKLLIPCFDDFYNIIKEICHSTKENPKILDIGAGTGLLSKIILEKYPNAILTLIDISEKMLNIAKERFVNNQNINYIVCDYTKYEFKEKYDIVISSLSIHHLENKEKRKLYKKIYEILNNDGIFVNGDQFLSPYKENEEFCKKIWFEKIEKTNLTEEDKKGAYDRMKMDKPATIDENLKYLKKAGFKNTDLFYKYYVFGIIYGKKIA
ncbi:MAG: methyltransferase [Spirochaetes bacterium GWD1_27_9]|nr:MAG: methyltransferase [Spirochaetes bacterium GWB1_27_13]OHD25454.1 MAG: methyltransferase [Spirochaetes bacterium GWC1_27_15]OHD44383.1 MAG: methyltransferase [Spirochaetes bacterium GWD1_27_9]